MKLTTKATPPRTIASLSAELLADIDRKVAYARRDFDGAFATMAKVVAKAQRESDADVAAGMAMGLSGCMTGIVDGGTKARMWEDLRVAIAEATDVPFARTIATQRDRYTAWLIRLATGWGGRSSDPFCGASDDVEQAARRRMVADAVEMLAYYIQEYVERATIAAADVLGEA